MFSSPMGEIQFQQQQQQQQQQQHRSLTVAQDDYPIDPSLPSVTAIIPINNWARRDALLQAIHSVVNQTYRGRLETIVIDTSMDRRAKEELDALSFPRPVQMIHIEAPHGTWSGFPRNVGIHAANNTDYVAFQDSDDVWFPNKLELQFDFMKLYNEFDFVVSEAVLPKRCRRSIVNGSVTWTDWSVDEMLATTSSSPLAHGGSYRRYLGSLRGSPVTDGSYLPALMDRKIVEWNNCALTPGVMIRRSILIDHGLFFNETQRMGEDWDMWKRMMSIDGIKLGYLSRPTFAVDRACHGGSRTNYQAHH